MITLRVNPVWTVDSVKSQLTDVLVEMNDGLVVTAQIDKNSKNSELAKLVFRFDCGLVVHDQIPWNTLVDAKNHDIDLVANWSIRLSR